MMTALSIRAGSRVPIRKGEPWGHELEGDAPDEVVRCRDDVALANAVWSRLDESGPDLDRPAPALPLFSVEIGDVATTLGGAGSGRLVLPMDLCVVRLDGGEPRPFVAHLIARRRFWLGEAAAVMNAAWLESWYLGPRAHPNDGLVDVTVGSLPLRQRLEAKRRAPTGMHLPHPDLTVVRRSSWSHRFERATSIELDGRPVGAHHEVDVEVLVDAFQLLN